MSSRQPKAKHPKAAAKRRVKRKANAATGKNDKHEVELLRQLSSRAMPTATREYRFDPERRWRFDLAWPSVRLAVEIEGGIYMGGRHVTPIGFTKDCEKYNAAALHGWIVLRYVPEHIKSGYAVEQINRLYNVLLTMKDVIRYGEEVLFGTGKAIDIKRDLDAIFAGRTDTLKLAGLLVGSINKRKRNTSKPAANAANRNRKTPAVLRDEQESAGKEGGD